MLEVKGAEGYADFNDAYYGNVTYYAHYFPRVAKLNISDATVSKFELIGDAKGKYLLYNSDNALVWDAASRSRFYIGRDKKFKTLFVGKYAMP